MTLCQELCHCDGSVLTESLALNISAQSVNLGAKEPTQFNRLIAGKSGIHPYCQLA
ncbi:hypothetical protein N657DRAFT_647473 [Parathielavia appendiculata]|uniref:Uncharacterized protein n=1 Tax=Parathielavia appendiculata TaxID=2587402 RepID=A0AAN6TWD0_9PEZI|nr:hypothetical protein N657DRAFT_647473 [Parathielavia appendiculata]